MKTDNKNMFVADFETTTYPGQTNTEVWAAAFVRLWSDEVTIVNNIEDFIKFFEGQTENSVCYFHNLKFDGMFILSYLATNKKYKQASIGEFEKGNVTFLPEKKCPPYSYRYTISNMGQFYEIKVKMEKASVSFRDSLKIMPSSVDAIAKAFKTKAYKESIDYHSHRHGGEIISEEEKSYITGDVLVIKEALEYMFSQHNPKLTIGAMCLEKYKDILCRVGDKEEEYRSIFPNLEEIVLDPLKFGADNADEYIRKAYKGGYCEVTIYDEKPKTRENGMTLDVNGLYSYVMHSKSGNRFPVGRPTFWKGRMPRYIFEPNIYWFMRFRCRFNLKKGYLPFVQVKTNIFYKSNENLKTSDIYNKETGEYEDSYLDVYGKVQPALLELTMSCTEFTMFRKHYDVTDLEILDGCYFQTEIGIFDEYIDYFQEMKQNNTGALRQIAKYFLNNLYGKLASSSISNYKVFVLGEDNLLKFTTVFARDKEPGHIACGAAITAYAKAYTLTNAQKLNEVGNNDYCDTDSCHCDDVENPEEYLKIDSKALGAFKIESKWDRAFFIRQKTYIEHIVWEDGEYLPEDKQYYKICCAGLPARCKQFLDWSLRGATEEEMKNEKPNLYLTMSDEEKEFCLTKRIMTDFKPGFTIPGKLVPRQMPGGVVLTSTPFTYK